MIYALGLERWVGIHLINRGISRYLQEFVGYMHLRENAYGCLVNGATGDKDGVINIDHSGGLGWGRGGHGRQNCSD
jgi:hypothetical protein